MSRKLRPKHMTIGNQWQADQMVKIDTKGEFTAALQDAMDDIGLVVTKHSQFTVALVIIGLLDGMEHEGAPGLSQTIRDWHQRAVAGKRSWEAN